ncbi:class I SAM-dependent RNA methyltransferase [Mangrovihabitans endophyticus]|uniref:23S rRNA methyltransferase n=1 Tax=Mangrovihabitans endophyticus TaxID=1751298 RepID=A0A8J3C3P4_9ACTN|nr:TRAM domain-containing protein [Mangrovihabitans endophyticus]GGL13975.1 23S rRNA methyltransferase [Mangrovihabitans endophyticus]
MTDDVAPDLVEGDRVTVTVGAVAHGGHCVARIGGDHGWVVFVRHALPGERVTVEITERHRGHLRGDAVEIHSPSADRVTPPCRYAHPGGCGGCDLQHVAPRAQREWKAAVVREQLTRLARLTEDEVEALGVRVEELPGGSLGWRTRVRYAVDAAGRAGLLQHRSHQVVPVDRCLIAHPRVQSLDLLARSWPTESAIEVVTSADGEVSVSTRDAGGDAGDDARDAPGPRGVVRHGPAQVRESAAGREWHLPTEAFWQVHPSAPDVLCEVVLDMLRPAQGESVWDLYGGAGLFAAAVAGRTGGRAVVVESAPAGVAAARNNLADLRGLEVVAATVQAALTRRRLTGPVDLVVLDPPRSGAGATVVRTIARAGPRAVAYVACDPAALARDIATFRAAGFRLAALRAFDCFPMTQHVECVALLTPDGTDPTR